MSTTPNITDNSILAWSDMESLDHAYHQALKKGDVMKAMQNVLAILTLLNHVNTAHETEEADNQTRNVETLQQIQRWIEEEGLTAEEIATRVVQQHGEDFLANYQGIDALLLAAAPDLSGNEELFRHTSIEDLATLINAAASEGQGIDLSALLDLQEYAEYVSIINEAAATLGEMSIAFMGMAGGVNDPETQDWLNRYYSASSEEEKEAVLNSWTEHHFSRIPYYQDHEITDSIWNSHRESLRNGAEAYAGFEGALIAAAESNGLSEIETQVIIAMSAELLRDTSATNMLQFRAPGSETGFDVGRNAALDILNSAFSATFNPIVDRQLDFNDPDDVKVVADYLTRGDVGQDPQAASDAAALNHILKDTLGFGFSALESGVRDDPNGLVDRVQEKIDVDTRLSDNQAISLKQLLQEQQVLLTMISEIINLNARLKRMITQ